MVVAGLARVKVCFGRQRLACLCLLLQTLPLLLRSSMSQVGLTSTVPSPLSSPETPLHTFHPHCPHPSYSPSNPHTHSLPSLARPHLSHASALINVWPPPLAPSSSPTPPPAADLQLLLYCIKAGRQLVVERLGRQHCQARYRHQ